MNENGFFKMEISDPEIIRKIQENGIESLDQDDINSFGVQVQDGQISFGDASGVDLGGSRRVRMQMVRTGETEKGFWPLRRGLVGFFVAMIVVWVILSMIGIISCKMIPQFTFTNKDMIFLALFLVVALAISLNEFRVASAAKKYLTERVQGQCISQEFASGKRQTRRSIFEYTYQDKVYRRCENTYANKGYAKVGEVRELMIAPENPGCIYDPIAGKASKIGGITIGMIFFVLIAVILVSVYING